MIVGLLVALGQAFGLAANDPPLRIFEWVLLVLGVAVALFGFIGLLRRRRLSR